MAQPLKKAAKSPRHHSAGGRGGYASTELLSFVSDLIGREPSALKRLRAETPKLGLPPISIGPEEGRLLDFLVRSISAKRAVEVGTLAGYSAAWIASALAEGGVLHSVEFDPKHAEVARENLKALGLDEKVFVHEGSGASVLPGLAARGPFDFCFIDADKVSYPLYLRWAVDNVRPGGIVVGDNAYAFGKLHLEGPEAGEDAAAADALRRFLKGLTDPRHFSSCAMIPTGEGLAVAVRR